MREATPGLRLGFFKPVKLNSITNVPGAPVNVTTNQSEEESLYLHYHDSVATGLEQICALSGISQFNGCGELTGSHWIEKTGLLTSLIILTSSAGVGDASWGIYEYCYRYCLDTEGEMPFAIVPVVRETYDGFLSDIGRFQSASQHVTDGLNNTPSDAVPQAEPAAGPAPFATNSMPAQCPAAGLSRGKMLPLACSSRPSVASRARSMLAVSLSGRSSGKSKGLHRRREWLRLKRNSGETAASFS